MATTFERVSRGTDRRISSASGGATMRAPIDSTFASLWARASRAVNRSLHKRGAHTVHLVRGDLLALAAAAEHDAEVGVARDDDATDVRADRRVVDRLLGIRAAVVDVVVPLLQHLDQVLLEREARVVGADRDPHPASVPTVRVPVGCLTRRLRCDRGAEVEAPRVTTAMLRRADEMCRRRLARRARRRQAHREQGRRRPVRRREPARRRRPPRARRRCRVAVEAFVEPRELEPEQRALYRAGVRGYLARVRATGPVGPPTSVGALPSPALGVDLIGDLGHRDRATRRRPRAPRRQARRASRRRTAARPGRVALRCSCGPRSGRRSTAHRRRRPDRTGVRRPRPRPRGRARRGRGLARRACRARQALRGTAGRAPGADCNGCAFVAGCSAHAIDDRAAACRDHAAHADQRTRRSSAAARAFYLPRAARRARERRGAVQRPRPARPRHAVACPRDRLLPRRRPRRATCSSVTVPTATPCATWSRVTRALPVGRGRTPRHTSTTSRASTAIPLPMFMATARIDAIWIHDGLLDARDYKTGKLWHTRVCDVPAAKVQAFVLGAGRHGAEGCDCGCATSTSNPRSTTIPSRGSRTTTTSTPSKRSCARAPSSACGSSTTGSASPKPTCAARCQYRSICRDSAAPASPRGRCSASRSHAHGHGPMVIAAGLCMMRANGRPGAASFAVIAAAAVARAARAPSCCGGSAFRPSSSRSLLGIVIGPAVLDWAQVRPVHRRRSPTSGSRS